jgi:hypothetical protein
MKKLNEDTTIILVVLFGAALFSVGNIIAEKEEVWGGLLALIGFFLMSAACGYMVTEIIRSRGLFFKIATKDELFKKDGSFLSGRTIH